MTFISSASSIVALEKTKLSLEKNNDNDNNKCEMNSPASLAYIGKK